MPYLPNPEHQKGVNTALFSVNRLFGLWGALKPPIVAEKIISTSYMSLPPATPPGDYEKS